MPAGSLPLPHHSQEEEYSCTPACVRMVLAYYGLSLPEADVAQSLGTTTAGTPFHGGRGQRDSTSSPW